jgi:nucleoside-diphosphate-sugar epimerase
VKILLTGISGFIGSAFARLALSKSHDVAGLLRDSSRVPLAGEEISRMTLMRGTLENVPWSEVGRFQPEVCVHAAWLTTPGVYLESPENFTLVEASVQFARKLRESGIRHLVVLGTCFEYKPIPEPLLEDISPIEPATVYARAKNELRLRLEGELQDQGFGLCWARVFYPYGPGEHPSRLCTAIAKKLLADEPIRLKTPQSTKDYIYIDDLTEAILKVVQTGFSGRINLGTGNPVQIREVAALLGNIIGKGHLISEADPPDPDPLPWLVAEPSRLRSLAWNPRVDLESGLRRVVQSL